MAVVEPAAFDAAGRRLRVAASLVLAVCIFGIFACDFLVASGVTSSESVTGNRLRPLTLHEPPFLWLLAGFAILVWAFARRWRGEPRPRPRLSGKSLIVPAILAALAVLISTVTGALVLLQEPAGLPLVVSPLFAAISILSLAGAATRLWPGDVRRGRLAILYLATSAQFLLGSMGERQWAAAYLCVNLLWLYLVLRDDRFGRASAPWIGVAALALQNPLAHAFVAAPFLLRVLRTGRLGWIGYYVVVYGAGAAALYYAASGSLAGLDGSILSLGEWEIDRYFAQGMNLAALLSWQAPAMALFLVTAVLLIRVLRPAERDLLTGLALTVVFYTVFGASGDHVWEYHQLFPVLGSAALLAASATVTLAAQRGGALVPRLVVVSTGVALMIQLPLRARHVERSTRSASTGLESRP